jgi:mono/diheme cytochrome c family protein
MRRAAAIAGVAALASAGVATWALVPGRLPATAVAAEGTGDAARGEQVFWAGGCASCHATPGGEATQLGGGEPLVTPFGTFHAPNISSDREAGIGAWSLADFANAMQRGVDPAGAPLYPAFPYTSYARMSAGDVADLHAYLLSLPSVSGVAPPNDLRFPFNIRRGVAVWQKVFLDPEPVAALTPDVSDEVKRGQYLVEGPGHCGECHTPRSFGGLGAVDRSRWLAGGPAPDGKGSIPNITPGGPIGAWSQDEIAEYLATGFTPDFDSVGGSMAEVQANLSHLPRSDLNAIAAYLKAVPAIAGTASGR